VTEQTPNPVEPAAGAASLTGAEALAAHLRSLTRLMIGGAEVGLEELLRLLQVWEAETARLKAEGASPAGSGLDEARETRLDRLRYAITGWLLEKEASLVHGAYRAVGPGWRPGRLLRAATRPLNWSLDLLLGSRLAAPFRRRFESLAALGEREAQRWIALGREEEAHNRLLAKVAFDKAVDEYIEYLTQNPEVQELVQKQSSGLANEVIEEVRERTVSADTFLEGLARSLLRRFPRRELPAPPPEVIARAASSRSREEIR